MPWIAKNIFTDFPSFDTSTLSASCWMRKRELSEVGEGRAVSNEEGKRLFSVSNLSECPEDAIIGRDLFDASDYINAVRFGMELAKNGYDDIEEVWTEDEDE